MREIYLLLLAIFAIGTHSSILSHEATQEVYVSSSKILKTITRLDNQRQLSMRVCDPYVLSIYIAPATSGNYEPFTTEQAQVTDYCPNIQTSCCNRSQIEYQIKYFQGAVEKINKYETFLDKMHKTMLKKTRIERLQKIIENFNNPKNRMCIGTRRSETAKTDLKEYLDGLATATERFRAIKEANIKYYSGFICSFCNGETSRFITNLDYQKTSKFMVKYKFANVKPALQIYDQFLDFMLYVVKLKNTVDIIDCAKKDKFLYLRAKDTPDYEAMNGQISICLNLADNPKEFMMNNECKDYFTQPNLFDYSDDYQHIIEVYSRAYVTLSEFFSIKDNIMDDILSSDVSNSVEYFHRRVKSSSSWEKSIGVDLDDRDGVDMFESPFSPSLYSSNSLSKTLIAILLLVTLIIS